MPSLEEAYSIEYGDVIDPELAYDLYWAGVIKDKKAFSCPSSSCDAKVTCINLDKEMQDMQQSPHFRGYHHKKGCDATTEEDKRSIDITEHEQDKSKTEKSSAVPDKFYTKRPAKQFAKKHDLKHKNKNITFEKVRKGTKLAIVQSGSDYYSVKSLVSKFIRYKREETLDQHSIDISGRIVTYKNLFKGVYEQNVEDLQENEFLYWGVAFIDHYPKKQCYRINFGETLTYKNKSIRPSFFIHQSTIDEYPVRNLVIKRLEKIVKTKSKRAMVFILSKPYATSKSESKYVNFEMSNLDYLEIREPGKFFESYARCN